MAWQYCVILSTQVLQYKFFGVLDHCCCLASSTPAAHFGAVECRTIVISAVSLIWSVVPTIFTLSVIEIGWRVCAGVIVGVFAVIGASWLDRHVNERVNFPYVECFVWNTALLLVYQHYREECITWCIAIGIWVFWRSHADSIFKDWFTLAIK